MARSRFGAPALERGIAIVERLAETPGGLRTEEIADALAIPRSSAFGLVRALHGLGWLEHDGDGRHRLGLRPFTLTAGAARERDVQRVAAPHLRELRDQLALTVHLAVLGDEGVVVYVDKIDGPGFVRFDTYVGKRSDAHLTAVGKALLATLPESAIAAGVAHRGFRRGTGRGAQTAQQLRDELAATRARGYALEDQEEVDGVRCVAAPVGGGDAPAPASIGCIGLVTEIGDEAIERVAAQVRGCAARVAEQLGTR